MHIKLQVDNKKIKKLVKAEKKGYIRDLKHKEVSNGLFNVSFYVEWNLEDISFFDGMKL